MLLRSPARVADVIALLRLYATMTDMDVLIRSEALWRAVAGAIRAGGRLHPAAGAS